MSESFSSPRNILQAIVVPLLVSPDAEAEADEARCDDPDASGDAGDDVTIVLRWRTAMARRCGICPRTRCTFQASDDGQGMCAVHLHEYTDHRRRGSPEEAVIVAHPFADDDGCRPVVVALRGIGEVAPDADEPAEPAVTHRLERIPVRDGHAVRAVILPPETDLQTFLAGHRPG